MQPDRYRVIACRSLPDLEAEVNRILQNGGELVGGVSCVQQGSYQELLWIQAVMCRY